ncbi:MAG: DNA polymerase I [Alphaproteobacteria bacterium CG_4_10_14_0_2_um_filter_63_37]|nr:MAG: DNA polymerase I [Proteobacteria bacterium CG1_02_64_396]PJA25400.1 MAG: DNA polymerase I [Alphaproteobacteria bacterium CG_4_10_14_0_2_um_filter_63_37]
MTETPHVRPHLVLIDGSNIVFRAFHAIRSLSNSKGEPTNAVFGFVQMIRSVLDKLAPSHVAVAFDPKGGTFRNEIFPDYKGHRPPMPEDLVPQWPIILEVTRAFRFPLLEIAGYEADDVIATLARQASAQGWQVTIVSGDKDLMQLVGGHVVQLDTMKDARYDAEGVKGKWGVGPDRIRDLLALTGDSSDNVPGVPGIGPKTAVALLEEYGDLEGVLTHAGQVKQTKRREALLEYADTARLAYRLVGLDEQTPLPTTLDDLTVTDPDAAQLVELFTELEFKTLTREFGAILRNAGTPSPQFDDAPAQLNVRTVQDETTFSELLAALSAADLIAVDTETTSLIPHQAKIVGLCFAVKPGEGWYVPVGHVSADPLGLEGGKIVQLPRDRVLAALKPILEDPAKPKCGHNLKYDAQILRRYDIALRGVADDSMLLAYCLYPGKYPPSLDNTAQDYLGHTCISFEEVAGKGVKQITFDKVPLETAAPYAAEDAEVTLRLSHLLRRRLHDEDRVARHDAIELPLMAVLADMEWTGVRIDPNHLAALSQEFGAQIADLEAQVIKEAGVEFNIHSPKQLGEVLFDQLQLPGGKRSKKSGAWSTSQEVLENLADLHPVPALILQTRSLAKLKSTYTDALPKLILPETGRVHTSYNQAITTTGRLSSTEPNLQNIPIRTEEGRRIRKAFVAAPGCKLIAADYSQIELRLMAHFSGDANLIAAFQSGHDIHRATAAAISGVDPEQVDSDMRRRAKIVNFGILYGMSAFGLAMELGITRGEAGDFIDAYFAQFPTVRDFMDRVLVDARANGYVETLLGHRCYLPEINGKNPMLRQYAERTAVNAPLQGSAADIIKRAMIDLHAALQAAGSPARMILQVHDELVVEAPEGLVDQTCALIKKTMEGAVTLTVPLEVEIGVGDNWLEAH